MRSPEKSDDEAKTSGERCIASQSQSLRLPSLPVLPSMVTRSNSSWTSPELIETSGSAIVLGWRRDGMDPAWRRLISEHA
jgi:hypothetical protein